MKRIFTVVLAALMGAFIFGGCDSKDTNLSVVSKDSGEIQAYRLMQKDDEYYIKPTDKGIELMTESYYHLADITFVPENNDSGEDYLVSAPDEDLDVAEAFANNISKVDDLIQKIEITENYEQDDEMGYLLEIYLDNNVDLDINKGTSICLPSGYSLTSGGSVNELDGKVVEQKSIFFILKDSVVDMSEELESFLFTVNDYSYYVSVTQEREQ